MTCRDNNNNNIKYNIIIYYAPDDRHRNEIVNRSGYDSAQGTKNIDARRSDRRVGAGN